MNASIARKALIATAGTLAVGGAASAAEIFVSENISTSVTWTADNVYRLQNQIYVLPGASLTIEPGTVIASIPTPDGSGSLAVCRGAQIYVLGTPDAPVIMTSADDDFVNWREAANEWGNLTIMGNAYISDSFEPGNSATFSASNVAAMEGLVAGFPGDTRVLYGGGDDDDHSGCINYLSIRYGGRVVGLGNELNGLSLGGIGRETDIQFVEIMNNVDDGIEIWGGTVNLKYASVWNIGDDSIDCDQGWRGQMQFVLIVQGYSLDASQGSGVGDNCFEMDGAENSDAQPVLTSTIYNATVIGQPAPGAGDQGMAFRDNANVQYRNCIFMDIGDAVVKNDNVDGDGSQGYGFNGTLSWAARWTTPYNTYSTVNAPENPAQYYTAQTSGNLIEVKDSVFFRNSDPNAYNEAIARGVFDAANDNVLVPGADPSLQPIVSITRAAPVTKGGKTMLRVIGLDPRATGDAATSASTAPNDGFFTPAAFRGAFAPDSNWLCGWSAASAYGFIDTPIESCGEPVFPSCFDLPTVPTLIEPIGIVEDAVPTFVWTAVPNATWYQLWVNDSTGNRVNRWYTATQVGASSGLCGVSSPVTLAIGAGTWWVRCWFDETGSGDWSPGVPFEIQVAFPNPTTVAPAGSTSTVYPLFSWEPVESATWYQVWANDSTGNRIQRWYTAAQVGADSGLCQVAPGVAMTAGPCVWWVRAWNSAEGSSPWSPPRQFVAGVWGAPVLVAPEGSSSSTPTYRWQPVAEATWYRLWVNDSTGTVINQWLTAEEVDASSGQCSFTPDVPLASGECEWWVQPWRASSGSGPWSLGLSFVAP